MRWFCLYYLYRTWQVSHLFTHSHVVNGVTIVHSHPFKKTLPIVIPQSISIDSFAEPRGDYRAGIFFSLFSLLLICSIPFRGVRIGQDTVRPSWAWYLCGHLLPEDRTSLSLHYLEKIYLVILLSKKMKMNKYIFFLVGSVLCPVACYGRPTDSWN